MILDVIVTGQSLFRFVGLNAATYLTRLSSSLLTEFTAGMTPSIKMILLLGPMAGTKLSRILAASLSE